LEERGIAMPRRLGIIVGNSFIYIACNI
jgi:hypothetical protein